MLVKVQCGCGTRYAFDVEPQRGMMPYRVTCPSCNADGTHAANEMIAQSSGVVEAAQPKLRIQGASAAAAPVASATAEDTDLPPPPVRPVGPSAMEKIKEERRGMRRALAMMFGVALLVCALIGGYIWYCFVGSKPSLVYTDKLEGAQNFWRSEFLPDGRLLSASPGLAVLRDIHAHRQIWSTPIPGTGGAGMRPPQIFAEKQNIWLCEEGQVVRLDENTGELKQTIPIAGDLQNFTPNAANIMVVSSTTETQCVAMDIDLATGEVARRTIEVPHAQQHAMPDELPPNVQPTAGVLLSQALEEQKFNKPLDAVSSEFFSAGQNLIELRVTLVKPNVTWVKSIKPKGPSLVNGELSTATSTARVAEEVFNDIKRDQTGGVKSIDESTYQVRVRRWLSDQPVEWKAEVTGVPRFFSLSNVDLVVAGKGLTVLDKKNTKLFDAQLSYPIGEQFSFDEGEHAAPAVERDDTLYFYDQAVLTAFSLPGGEVKWRLTSVGISRAQFDEAGAIYLNTTAGTPEDIQYSDQIKLESTAPVIMKVDAHSGKILWQTQNLGQEIFLSGKYVYSSSAQAGGIALANGLAEALNTPRPERVVHYHIYRLDGGSGRLLWRFYRDQEPEEQLFQKNWIVLRFGNDLQVYKYLDF
jgi:outer membrane protein assembly factor BamB